MIWIPAIDALIETRMLPQSRRWRMLTTYTKCLVLVLQLIAWDAFGWTPFAATGKLDARETLRAASALRQAVRCGKSHYRVKPGDTLAAIARRAGVSARAVRRCNGLTSSVIYTGQILSLPGVVRTPSPTSQTRIQRKYEPVSPAFAPVPPGSPPNPYLTPRRPTPVPNR